MLKAEEPQWPPRSPREALLASPNGRKRLREIQDRLSASPSASPMKKSKSMPFFRQRSDQLDGTLEPEEEDDEDEETLQLKLQAIETKLKLKRLREAKARGGVSDPGNGTQRGTGHLPRSQSVAVMQDERKAKRPQTQEGVEVPSSPQKKTVVAEPKSPGRVLLGIDKGLRGRDVSLRRAPSLRKDSSKAEDPFRSVTHNTAGELGVGKSFSERIAEIRSNDRSREQILKQKQAVVKSKNFGIDKQELERLTKMQEAAAASSGRTSSITESSTQEFTRDQILATSNTKASRRLPESKSTTSVVRVTGSNKTGPPLPEVSLRSPGLSSRSRTPSAQEISQPSEDPASTVDGSLFESMSSFHLSKRHLPHTFLMRTISDKKVLLIPDLLRIIKAPEFDAPEVNEDFVVFGVIASKSEPKSHKSTHQTATNGDKDESGRGKYMIITLTDLKWELDLFLFGTGFDRFWKLTPGTLIAILNPSIMPPPSHKRDTGKFSLTLNSSDDTVLEIGTARDLGFCKSVKKDGKTCDQWVDNRHTEFCDFHVDLRLRKTQASRMEVNTMTGPFGPGGRTGSRTGFWAGRRGAAGLKEDGLKKEGPFHDRETNSQIYIGRRVPGASRSTASLLDDEDVDPDAFHRGTNKEERLRRRLAEREREREIGRKLGVGGNGLGGEYLRARHNAEDTNGSVEKSSKGGSQETVDAASLGLLGVKASEVQLSPIKRKRQSSGEAVGWGSAFKRGLPSPTKKKTAGKAAADVVAGTATQAPAKKKTRFITAKGIREAGRESLGNTSGPVDDDDDLDIV